MGNILEILKITQGKIWNPFEDTSPLHSGKKSFLHFSSGRSRVEKYLLNIKVKSKTKIAIVIII